MWFSEVEEVTWSGGVCPGSYGSLLYNTCLDHPVITELAQGFDGHVGSRRNTGRPCRAHFHIGTNRSSTFTLFVLRGRESSALINLNLHVLSGAFTAWNFQVIWVWEGALFLICGVVIGGADLLGEILSINFGYRFKDHDSEEKKR
jgi:hypothetical protein